MLNGARERVVRLVGIGEPDHRNLEQALAEIAFAIRNRSQPAAQTPFAWLRRGGGRLDLVFLYADVDVERPAALLKLVDAEPQL